MNRWMEPGLWDFVAQQAMQVTMVAIVVLILVRLFAKDRPHLAHSLWALVLLKCIMPPVVALPTSPFSWLVPSATVSEGRDATAETQQAAQPESALRDERGNTRENAGDYASVSAVVEFESKPTLPTENADVNINAKVAEPLGRLASWRGGLIVAWLVSSAVSLLSVVFRLQRFLTKVQRASLSSEEVCVRKLSRQLQRVAKQVGLSDPAAARVRVQVVDANIGPAVVGVLRPTVLLPRVIVDESSPEDLGLLLAHELIHVRRGDLGWAAVQTLATSLWWFHPLILCCARWFDREAERSCDEETIASVGCQPVAYARSLLLVLERKHQLQIAPALPGVRPVDITRKRMDRIMRMGHGSHARSPWWCSGVLLIGAVVALPGAAWVVAQDNVVESKPLVGLLLPKLNVDVPSEAIIERQYDLSETLEKTQQGRSREEALLEIKTFVLSAVDAWEFSSSAKVQSDLGVIGVVKVEEPMQQIASNAIEIDADGNMIVRGGLELHQSVRNELDRLKQYGADKLSIETRFITIPAELLKELEVDWELLQDDTVVSAASGVKTTGDNPSGISNFVVTASAVDASNYQLPVLTAQLSPEALEELLASIQRNPKSNVLTCPKLTMFNGQEASICDSVQHPFVVGMQAVKSGDKEAQQPVVRVIPSGTSLHLRPEMLGESLTLSCTVELSKIEDVGTFSYRRTGQAAGEGVSLQVPRVAATSLHCVSQKMACNESFVIATLRPGVMSEVMIIVVTPQKIEATSDATSAIENAFKKVEATAATQEPKYGDTSRITIIGPINVKGETIVLDPPSDDEIMQALQKTPSGKAIVDQSQRNPKRRLAIVKEKTADYLDPRRFVPLIGDAQLHHSHYKCTVYLDSTQERLDHSGIEPCIVYVDHQHFYLVGGE